MSDAARADALLADMSREGRGRLKVFLGAAPGVGKTFAMLQAAQARLAPAHDCVRSRLLIAALCYGQPLVRAWARYRTRYFTFFIGAFW